MATIVGTNGEESWICDDKGEVIEVFESTGCEYNDLNMCRGCPVCRLHPEEAYGFDDDWSCEEWEAWAREGEDVEVQEPEEELKARLAAFVPPAPKPRTGWLNVYARLSESADKGAIIRNRP